MEPLNISFFVSNLDSGGIENYLLRYLKNQNSEFKNIYIFCKSGKGGVLENEYLNISNLKVIRYKFGYMNVKSMLYLGIFLKSKDVNIVCDFTGNFSGPVLYISKLIGVEKRIALYRSSTDRFNGDIFRNSYNKFLNRIVNIYATDILANSEAGLSYFFPYRNLKDPRFEVIRNGVDANYFLTETRTLREDFNLPKNAFVIGHTGRFNEAKNHKVILSVAKILVDRYSNIYFILCGNGVKSNLYEEVKLLGIADQVLVFENRRDIPRFLNTMDCYFFPSITEGQPNSLIEAMIMGLPFVASDIAPIKETVFDSERLHHPNDIQSFVESLTCLYKASSSKDLVLQKKAVEKFNHIDAFAKFTARIYDF